MNEICQQLFHLREGFKSIQEVAEVLEYCDKYNFESFVDKEININQFKNKVYERLGASYVCQDDLKQKLDIDIPESSSEQIKQIRELVNSSQTLVVLDQLQDETYSKVSNPRCFKSLFANRKRKSFRTSNIKKWEAQKPQKFENPEHVYVPPSTFKRAMSATSSKPVLKKDTAEEYLSKLRNELHD